MATKSDFAQKLLHDLRLRKEKMTATQNSSRHAGQASRDMHGNTGRTNKGSQQINALESSGYRTGNMSRRSNKGSRSNSFAESSNQIVLYDKEQSSTQVRDLSMAIAFAFENSGKFNKGTSSSNPLVNFFNRFGRRSMDCRKMDITTFDNISLSTSPFPNVSNIHISEISKGVQKLNQILRACSNGINFDINSIEVGKELLKGSIDLEESLRMLVNLQEASVYRNGGGAQQRSRIKLLEEDEDSQEETEKTTDHWQLSRPRFSFDKTSRNSHVIQSATKNNSKGRQLAISYLDEASKQPVSNSKINSHKKSASCAQDLRISTQVKLNNNSSLSQSTQDKGRLPNVIAKLMGLEELPQIQDSTGKQKETKKNVSSKINKLPEPLNRDSRKGLPLTADKKLLLTHNTLLIRDSKLHPKAEKSHETPDGSSKIVKSKGNKPQKDSKILAVGMDSATTMTQKQQNQVEGHQIFQNGESKQNLKEESEREIIETKERKAPVLNTELLQKAKNINVTKVEDTPNNRTECNLSANYLEKRITNKELTSNQQKSQDQRASLQVQVLKKPGHLEDKKRAEQKGQQLQKQNFLNKKREGKVESIISSKPKKVAAENLQKKISRDKSTPSNGKSTKFTEKVPSKDSENSRNQDDATMIDTSKNTAANQENFKKEDKSQGSSPSKPEFDNEKESSDPLLTQDKPITVSVTQKKAISQKVQISENPRKIDVLITRRNASATENRLTRSLKQSANMLQDLKQQIHNKRMELQSDSKVKEGEVSTTMSNASEMSTETLNQSGKLQNEAEHVITLHSSVADKYQTQNIQSTPTPTPNDNYDDISDSGPVSDYPQTVEQSCASKDAQELMQYDQSSGGHEEPTEFHNLPQYEYKQLPALGRQEQLTEPEKYLKEIVIKSQMFLNTAEALFKLNIPISFLHAGDHDDEVAGKKPILDCGYEVMKRKARRYEVTLHPYMKTTVTCTKVRSLDDLVKQLCRDFETLKSYSGNGSGQNDVSESLCKMLDNDINNKDPDVNSMWDFEWNKMKCVFPEKEDVIRDVEKHMLNGLLEEITNDLLPITISV